MQKGYDIIIPVYNEKNIIKLLDYLLLHVKNHNFIYICYDYEEDVTISIFNKSKYNKYEKIKLLKNPGIGPCEAIKNGLNKSVSDAAIVYPADDFYNAKILDEMYYYKTKGYDLVCPSRFIRGGIIKNCPLIKYLIVKIVSLTLFYLSSLKIKDPTNGFRLFSNQVLKNYTIESNLGFAYSLELLIKSHKDKRKIIEIPSTWIERVDQKSNFKILKWSKDYLKWFLKGILS
tara:strand:+ start:4460 stop:5152 length:693 start_codon:yes stop_codon:yes gene_type:complete